MELAQARAAAAEARAALAAAKADGPGGGGPVAPAAPGMADPCGSWLLLVELIDVARLPHQFLWNCGSPTHTVQDSQIHMINQIMIKALY